MYKKHCLNSYTECINAIDVPDEDNMDMENKPWIVYSNDMKECNELFDFCNENLDFDSKNLDKKEIEKEYALLVKEAETKNSGGYKAKKKSKTKKHSKNKKHYKTKKRSKTKKYYKTKKRYKTNKLSKKCSKTKH